MYCTILTVVLLYVEVKVGGGEGELLEGAMSILVGILKKE